MSIPGHEFKQFSGHMSDEPTPRDAMLILPGFGFASLINSGTVLAGKDGFTIITTHLGCSCRKLPRRFRLRAANAYVFEYAYYSARHEYDAQNEKNAIDRIGCADEIGGKRDTQTFIQGYREESADGWAKHRIRAADNHGENNL